MAVLGRIGNRLDPGPAALEPGRRADIVARFASALSELSGILKELTEDEAMAAYREARRRIDAGDELEHEG